MISNFRRFIGDVRLLTAPYLRSEEKWSARILLLVVFATDVSIVGVAVLSNLNDGAWMNALQGYDALAFFRLLLLWDNNPDGPFGIIPGFVPLILLSVGLVVQGRYLRQWLEIRWRRWMTAELQARWLTNQSYYRLQLQPDVVGNDNPDQRIAEDICDFLENGLELELWLHKECGFAHQFPSCLVGFVLPRCGIRHYDTRVSGPDSPAILSVWHFSNTDYRTPPGLAQFHTATCGSRFSVCARTTTRKC